MFEVLDVTGVLGGEAFLVLSEDDAVLVDTGFMFGARNMIEKIEHALGGRALTYILLTHSHYDHANGVTALLDAFPGAKVVGSAHTARTLGNERIFSGMIELDRNVARSRGVEDLPSPIRSLTVDLVVSEGDVLNTTDMKILVLDTPGHTKGD
jgi:glyoxylase-like metal-dependent hydrolase (beta-lactamase superfamily II)